MTFESNTYLNNSTAESNHYYTFNGKKCEHVTIKSKNAKRLVGLTLIRADLRKVLGWVKIIEQDGFVA